ncbi:MAG TPA: hypothetical protein VJU59_09505 [Paraburkholderia sp.]|uniref:hypothetical protein n=1 Tax=Paraburkholderia sp. TaxID=1926495 RepID=UPI002B4A4991|nr:hypothetical protein [Paraburkholderia sp.]HKR39900.1 hypothetical protein [Paraburkholderia sp.]
MLVDQAIKHAPHANNKEAFLLSKCVVVLLCSRFDAPGHMDSSIAWLAREEAVATIAALSPRREFPGSRRSQRLASLSLLDIGTHQHVTFDPS